jgi:tetratricopeptide (TPR) repeat protein
MAQSPNLPSSAQNEQFSKGVTALKADQIDEARIIFEELLALGMESPFVHHNLGITYQRLRRHQEAISQFQKALELEPTFAESRVLLGASLITIDRPEEGISELEKAVRALPDNIPANQQLAKAYEIHGTPFQVVAQYQRLSKLDPDNPENAFKLGLAYNKVADWSYREMMQLYLDSARVYQALAQSYLARQDWISAENAFRDAIKADPELPDLHISLASALIQQGKLEEALSAVEAELQLVPENLGAKQLKQQLQLRIEQKSGN